MMAVRVQVVLGEDERELFRRQAAAEGLSLSAWLRQAGRDRLSAERKAAMLDSVQALRAFFEECDQREEGWEPDWQEHLDVMAQSRGQGLPET